MEIGIIVAMSKELNLLLPLLEEAKTETNDGYSFHKGRIGNHQIIAMQCGIGKANAAIGTLALLNHNKPSLIINTGVAGGASHSVSVMDVVVGEQIAYHDVWCGPGTEYGEASGYPLLFKSDEKTTSIIPQQPEIKRGLICSGDKFISTVAEIAEIQSHFPNVLAVDMESATIAQVCHHRNIPFLSIRVISDSPGASHENVAQYNNFWEEAPQHTFSIVKNLLSKLGK